MKFVCQTCGTRYTISDEKVRNKRLKIRCKKCRGIIDVIDPARVSRPPARPSAPPKEALSEEEPISLVLTEKNETASMTPSSTLEDQFAASFQNNAPTQPAGAPGLLDNLQRRAETFDRGEAEVAVWFVGIDKAPVGPISAKAVRKYKQLGRINDDSLVWKEGMPDWLPLRACKALVGLLAGLELSEEVPEPEAAPSPSMDPNLSLFRDDESNPWASTPLKGADVGVIGATAKPAKETDIFAQVDLASAATNAQFGTGYRDTAFNDGFESEVSKLHHLTPPRAGGNRVYLLASVGFFITAVVTLAIVISDGGSAGESPPVKTVEKVVEKVVYRDRIVEKEVFREAAGDDVDTKKRKRRSPGKARNEKSKAPTDEQTQALMAQLGNSRAETGGGPVGRNESAKSAAGSGLAGTLSAAQMKRVVDRNKGALKACYERALKKGEVSDTTDIKVNFSVVVGGSGTVKSVTLKSGGGVAGSLKNCLSHSVKRWVFPAGGGDSPLEFPLVFTPAR